MIKRKKKLLNEIGETVQRSSFTSGNYLFFSP
jgi:hypothetical protein